MTQRSQQCLGWLAVGLSAFAGCFWSFWGIIENFHEGWYSRSLWENLGVLFGQYLLVPVLFVAAGLTGIRWPRLGGVLHLAAGIGVAWFFHGAGWKVVDLTVAGPLVMIGVLYWFGRPRPQRWAAAAIVGLPLLTLVVCGAEPAYRVAGRIDDGDRSARRVADNGVDLIWAPAGPGWPRKGVDWKEARRRCRYLTANGASLAQTPQDVWRLPTVEEAVRSQARHGHNSHGLWDATRGTATYQRMPDKESPLWDMHSPVIYWWTATELNDQQAYIIVYNGQVWPRPKRARWGYLGFRAVKDGAGH